MLDDSQDRKLVNELETFHWKLENKRPITFYEINVLVIDIFA